MSESDIQPSMVTNIWNSCSAFTHPSAHTQQWTHTVNTQPEQWAAIYAAGAQGEVRCLAQGHLSHGIEGGESAAHSFPPPTIPAGPRLELATFQLWVWLSTIRPRLPQLNNLRQSSLIKQQLITTELRCISTCFYHIRWSLITCLTEGAS